MNKAHRHRQKTLVFIKSTHLTLMCVIYRRHIKLCIAALEHISVTLLIFSLALITGDKPLKPALQENPQLCDRGAYQNARKAGLLRNVSQLGVKRQKAINDREICASVFQVGSRKREGSEKGIELLFWFSVIRI